MKKSQLRLIIREEISKVLKETTEDEIATRIRNIGKEADIADAAIEDYISDLSGHFEPDAYEGDTDEDLLKDLKLYIKNMLNEKEYTHPMYTGGSEYDKRYKNPDPRFTITDVEEIKRDTSGPWATTATSVTGYYVESSPNDDGVEKHHVDEVREWAESIWKSSYMVDRKVQGVDEIMPGEWFVEVKTTVWQN